MTSVRVALVALALSGCVAHVRPDVAHGFVSRELDGRKYLVYHPRDWTADRKWPVIVYLHGGGERGHDGLGGAEVGLGPFVSRSNGSFPFVVAFPQTDRPWPFPDVEARVLALVEATVRNESGDPDRVYLTGNSMGGFGTWIIGAHHPELFAALVPICGGVRPPSSVHAPPGSIASDPEPEKKVAQLLGRTPVWAFHGAKDWVAPPISSRRLVEAMKAAGGDIRYTEYPDLGHHAWDRAYADPALYEWLLAQHRAAR